MEKVSPFEIVKATWHDLNELHKLEKVCFAEDAWPFWDLIAVLTLPNIVRFKATVDEQMAGFIAGDPHPNEGVGWIATLGVYPEFRRQGIAKALLEQCENELHFARLRLSVRKSNSGAIKLYENAGYRMVDLWRNYYHSGEDALVLEKRR